MLGRFGLALILALSSGASLALTPDEIIAILKDPVHSTGNVADAVDETTGARGWMNSDMKPILDTKMVGRAATALMRPVLRTMAASTPIISSRSWIRRSPAASSFT